MGIFGKQTAKIGLAMHIGSSKHYARVIRRLTKAIKGDVKDEHEDVHKLDAAITEGSITKVKETMNQLIETCKDEAKELDKISEEVYVLEFRMEKDLKKLVDDLNELSKNPKHQTELKDALNSLYVLFKEIHQKILMEKRQMRDLKRDKNRLRDRTIKPNIMLFHSLRVCAKAEKRDVKKVSKVIHELQGIIEDLKKGKADKNSFEIIKKDTEKLKSEIEEELKVLIQIESAVVYLTERFKELNMKEFQKVRELAQKGFPQKVESEIALKEQEFLDQLKAEERKEYDRVRVVLGVSKEGYKMAA
ncbi:hypothetical protein ISS04_03850 [Candidatus Woesearchaeota archaeon]|nr:hypothetical protein [Candidatus Woesearchaeota archaeon]